MSVNFVYQTFTYRDVFFQLEILDDCNAKASLYVDGAAHGIEVGYATIWTGDGHPGLNELRKICDEYIERLISESIHAGGEVVCDLCNETYYNHPYFHGALAFGNERPYLRRRCDGKLLKL